ncbi:MAG: hypothetical protein ACO3SO_00230, partial [Luteolibacter sp.]
TILAQGFVGVLVTRSALAQARGHASLAMWVLISVRPHLNWSAFHVSLVSLRSPTRGRLGQ